MVGATREKIREKARKSDGTKPSLNAVDGVLERFNEEPEWDGGDSAAGGRKRVLTPKQEKDILKILQGLDSVPACSTAGCDKRGRQEGG